MGAKNPTPYSSSTYTPVVTLVGGSDTVPVYSTNSGTYTMIGNVCFGSAYFAGDGGAEGAGTTGQLNISLPFTANASQLTYYVPVGFMLNGTTYTIVSGQIAASGTTIALSRNNGVARAMVVGDDQNNTTRAIRIDFRFIIA